MCSVNGIYLSHPQHVSQVNENLVFPPLVTPVVYLVFGKGRGGKGR